MKTCFKLALRIIKKSVFSREVIISMFTVIFAFVIFLVSAVQIKLKDYLLLSKYLKHDGVLITSMGLSKSSDDGGFVVRDEDELADYLGDTADILCMEEVWETTVNKKNVRTYCYSKNVVYSLNPEMSSGRWFNKEDKTSDILKVVISYNNGQFKTGDHIKLKCSMDDELEQELEVIGILADDQLMFMGDTLREAYCDYRDCYKIISSRYDSTVNLFISDDQLSTGEFPYLNFRTGPDKGFQKQMKGVTLISFQDHIDEEEALKKIDSLRKMSNITVCNTLGVIRKGSITYITAELSTWIPMFMMLISFVLISLISVNMVMSGKMMGYYAVHYLCGSTWSQNAMISLIASFLEAVVAFMIIIIVSLSGKTALFIDLVGALACLLTALLIIFTAHISVLIMLGRTSAKEVFIENARRRGTW